MPLLEHYLIHWHRCLCLFIASFHCLALKFFVDSLFIFLSFPHALPSLARGSLTSAHFLFGTLRRHLSQLLSVFFFILFYLRLSPDLPSSLYFFFFHCSIYSSKGASNPIFYLPIHRFTDCHGLI